MRCLGLILFLLLLSPTWAQEELLPYGAYGTTIHGGIQAGEQREYLLKGEKGQVFKAHISTRDREKAASLELRDHKGESLLADLAVGIKVDALNLVLPQSGDYHLVISAGELKCSYILEVTLEDPEPPAPPSPEPSEPSTSPSEPVERPSEVDL